MTQDTRAKAQKVRAVIADMAGTTVDFGSCAPAGVFVKVFRAAGVEITLAEARGPMGMGKKDHIREILRLPRVSASWQYVNRTEWSERDVELLYDAFIPLQLRCLQDYNNLVPGVYQTVLELRQESLLFGLNTGYTRDMTQIVLEGMRQQGVVPDAVSCLSDVPAGRPAPWMLFDTLEKLSVYPPAAAVAVGDTPADVEAGRNGALWTVGVTRTGNLLGMTEREMQAADPVDVQERIGAAERVLRGAGAHYVVESFAEMPRVIQDIDRRMAEGERP